MVLCLRLAISIAYRREVQNGRIENVVDTSPSNGANLRHSVYNVNTILPGADCNQIVAYPGTDGIPICPGVSGLGDKMVPPLTTNSMFLVCFGVEIIHHHIRSKRYHCNAKPRKHARKHGTVRENRVFPPRFPLRPRVTKQRWVGHD
jgi:hypothetical protein